MTALLLAVIALLLACGYVLCREHKTDLARLNAVHREELARVADDAAFATEQWKGLTAENERLRLQVAEIRAEYEQLVAAFRAPLEIEGVQS